MFGMEMMIKALGIDPEELKKNVETFNATFQNLVAQLDRIEHKLDLLTVEKSNGEKTDD